MTNFAKTASALAIAMTALTSMTVLGSDASAKISRGAGHGPVKVHHVSPLIAKYLGKHLHAFGHTGGGTVISCSPTTGCTEKGGPTHHHPYGGWHRERREHARREHRNHWNWYAHERHEYPIVEAAPEYGPECAAPNKWSLRMVRHGFRHVLKKICVEAL